MQALKPIKMITPLIYKYTSITGRDILSNRRLLVADPRTFNDPFEFLPSIFRSFTDDMVEAKAKDPEWLQGLYKSEAEKGFSGPFDDWLSAIEAKFPEYLKCTRKTFETVQYDPKDFKELAAKFFGIICFAKERDNLLLWAHYADSHKGFAVGFDPKAFGSLLEPVDYSSSRCSYSPILLGQHRNEAMKKVLLRKSSEWLYENEQRAVIALKLCKKDGNLHFYEFDKRFVKEVILGANMDREVGLTLVTSMKSHYPHAKFYQAKPAQDAFSLQFDSI